MRKPRPHVSGQMRRDFARAILVGAIVAGGGFLLVHAALMPPRPKPKAAGLSVPPATCDATLAAWESLEQAIVRATAEAGDLGARCRLLSCPELDCARLQELRGTVSRLAGTVRQVAERPDSLVMGRESAACGAVLSPQADRLAPGLSEARQALDLCAEHSICEALRASGTVGGALEGGPGALKAETDQIAAIADRLSIAESPSPKIALDQTRYVAGDAIRATIDPARNRCLADGGNIGVFADTGLASLGRPLGSPVTLRPGPAQSLLLEAPQKQGRYLIAVTGRSGSGLALGSTAFDVENQRGTCSGFSGRWETDRGVLTASVRHGVLRGTYRRAGAERPGFLIGSVHGRHFHGDWTSELGAGGAHLVLTRQGDRFVGTAGSKPGSEDGAGLWRGSCVAGREKITE